MAQDGKIIFGFEGGEVGGAIPDVVQPPDFARARNVRLTRERGAPTKAPRMSDRYADTPAIDLLRFSGLMPHGRSRSALYLMQQPRRYTDASSSPLQRVDGATWYARGTWRSLRVADAGIAMPGRTAHPPVIAFDASGGRWVAELKVREVRSAGSSTYDGTVSVYVSYTDASGAAVLSSQSVADVDSGVSGSLVFPRWLSITPRASGGAVLWWKGFGTTGVSPIMACTLSVSGGIVTAGTPVAVLSPPVACFGPSVVHSGATAWVCSAWSSANVRVARVSVPGFAVEATRDVSATDTAGIATSLAIDSSASNLVLAYTGVAAAALRLTPSATMPVTATCVGVPAVGACAALLLGDEAGGIHFGIASSRHDVAMPSTQAVVPYPRVAIRVQNLSTSAVTNALIPHMRLAASVSTYERGHTADVVDAVLAVTPWYGPYSSPTDRAYVLDPALYLATVRFDANALALRTNYVARVGADRMLTGVQGLENAFYPGHVATGHALVRSGDRIAVGYLERRDEANNISDAGHMGRVVEFSAETYQPPVASIAGAACIAGGSMPLAFDGSELGETMPLQAPVLTRSSAGFGATLTGSYSYIAVVHWTDANGDMHRSAPSLPLSFDLAAQAHPDLYVTIPPTMHDGMASSSAIVRLYYAGDASGSATSVYGLTSASADAQPSNGCWRFSSARASVGAAFADISRAIYSDGSAAGEIPPDPMPPSREIALALDRLFAVDAESPRDVWYTKPLASGIAPEFSAELKVSFPAQAGEIVALAELGGQLVALGTEGIATLYGDGPDAYGSGAFGPPRVISRTGCVSRAACGRYPGGVVFLGTDGRWAKLSAEGVQTFAKAPVPSSPVRSWTLAANGSELVFWLDGEGHAYNYEADRWSVWTIPPLLDVSSGMVASENDTGNIAWAARFIVGSSGALPSRIDATLASDTEQARWETGHVIPAGDQLEDVQWRQIELHALSAGSHGLVVRATLDYGMAHGGGTQVHTFTPAQIAAATDPAGRYVLAIDLAMQVGRSIRLAIEETDAVGTAFRPISCEIHYSRINTQARRHIAPPTRR